MKILTFIFIILSPNLLWGQNTIQGKVIDQNGINFPFVMVYLFNNQDEVIDSTVSDMSGYFRLLHSTNDNLKFISGEMAGCFTDSIRLTDENISDIQLEICFSDSCRANLKIPNCRNNYIQKDVFYVEFFWDPDSILIVKGVDILKRESYSPFDFELILPDEKYSDNQGKIYNGIDLIKMRILPLINWEDADFKPIRKEIKCR